MANKEIHRKGVRSSLPPQREPYWTYVAEYTYLGFRKTEAGSQTWIARFQQGKKKKYSSLGAVSTHSFDKAKDLAKAFGEACRQGVGKPHTVAQAVISYTEYLGTHKGEAPKKDAFVRAQRTILKDPIAEIRLDRLTATHIRDWQLRRKATGSKASTVNRDFRLLKAMLNDAFKTDKILNTPWKKVDPLPAEDGKRELYLTLDQRRQLLDAAEPALKDILRGYMLTACRPGELRKARVKDFDEKTGTLKISTNKGRNGVERKRDVRLSNAAQVFFKERCRKGKVARIGSAFIFTQRTGNPWSESSLNARFRKARKAAGLPEEAVPYNLRHATIADWLLEAGIDVATVALMAGTSADMISKHYHKYIPSVVTEKLDQLEEI